MTESPAESQNTGPAEPVFWGKKWDEGGFEKNVIHFDKTAKVMRDIFDATHGFQKELGSRYTFLDIACAPGGFSRFLCSDPRCQRGWGISLPVTEGGFRLLFTWTHPDERKFQVKFRDMLTLEPEDCCEHLVDMIISDAQYLPLRKADQPGPDPALAKSQSVNPALGIWALLFQQLRLGLSNLRNGGVMMFRLNCKDGNVDWYFDCVCQVLAMIDRLFESMLLFKSGKSHQSDGTAYIICRGFCRCEFEAMEGAEILRKSIMVSRYELEVAALGMSPMFRKITATKDVRARTREVFSLVDDAIARYKDQGSFSYASTVKEWRCARSVPSLRRKVRNNMNTVMPMVASRLAAKYLEATMRDMDFLNQQCSELTSLEDLRAVLTSKCQEAKEKLQQQADELHHVIAAAHETSTDEIEVEEFNAGIFEDGWARTAEPEPASSEYLHVTGLLQGIEESTLQRCFGRAGKVEEIRFLPQDQAMASRCAALVKMSNVEEAKVAREKLDGVIPEGTGFELERTLMITFQVKNGIQVCDHLFVRGIPSAVQKHQIASLFNRYGQVLWSSILPQRLGEEDRCALVQMASSDEAQNAIQALNWSSSSALMPSMMVRYAGPKVFVALQETEGIHDEGEGSEEDEEGFHFGVIEEAPKPAFQPLKERPQEMGSRWKKAEEEDWEGPNGTRLWGWAMQPVKEAEEFPQLGTEKTAVEVTEEPESWEELGDLEPSEILCMKDPPPGLPDSVMLMWFKPYGHVLELWPLEDPELHEEPESVVFLVHMSCKEEAINAYNALNGKSIMRGQPLNLSYWHGGHQPPSQRPSQPSRPSTVPTVDSHRLLAAARDRLAKKSSAATEAEEAHESPVVSEVTSSSSLIPSAFLRLQDPPDFPEMVMQLWFKPYGTLLDMKKLEKSSDDSVAFVVQMSCEEEAVKAYQSLNGKSIMGKCLSLSYHHDKNPVEVKKSGYPGPGVGIDDQQLLEACKVALAQREKNQKGAVSSAPAGDVESWEDLDDDDASAPMVSTPSDTLRLSGVPPGIQEMVMQFWFRPYGQVQELRPLKGDVADTNTNTDAGGPAFLVKMSSVEEATAAMNALDGKPVMKGSPLVVRYL